MRSSWLAVVTFCAALGCGLIPRWRRRQRLVEVLVNIRGCSASPCQVAIGTFRDLSESALGAEIARKLREHLDAHKS